MLRHLITVAATVVLSSVSLACASLHHTENAAGTGDSGVAGHVAFEFVPDPGRVKPALSGQQVFLPPAPLETPLPTYPPNALAKEAVPTTVVVRIFVETDGTVKQVVDSPLKDVTRSGAGEAFRAAVEQRVRGWKFVPGRIRTLTEGEDIDGDGRPDYWIETDETPIRAYLDVRFKFEVVGGKGQVRFE